MPRSTVDAVKHFLRYMKGKHGDIDVFPKSVVFNAIYVLIAPGMKARHRYVEYMLAAGVLIEHDSGGFRIDYDKIYELVA